VLRGVLLIPFVPVPFGLVVDGVVEPGTTILLLPFGLVGVTGLGLAGVTGVVLLVESVEVRVDLVVDLLLVPLLFGVVNVPLPFGLVVAPPGVIVLPGVVGVLPGVLPFGVTPGAVLGVCALALLMVIAKSRLVANIANFFISFVV
jgi:hypothetical protein